MSPRFAWHGAVTPADRAMQTSQRVSQFVCVLKLSAGRECAAWPVRKRAVQATHGPLLNRSSIAFGRASVPVQRIRHIQ